MSAKPRRSQTSPPRHAQVHFPRMTTTQALLVIGLLERIEKAIWRVHGDDIADYLACVDPESPYMDKPFDAVWSGVPATNRGTTDGGAAF
jgi:hypothetical protein